MTPAGSRERTDLAGQIVEDDRFVEGKCSCCRATWADDLSSHSSQLLESLERSGDEAGPGSLITWLGGEVAIYQRTKRAPTRMQRAMD